MKTHPTSLLALFVALSASAFAAPPTTVTVPSPAPFGFSVNTVDLPNQAEITRGTTLMTVRRLMGTAQRELSPDVWAYYGYHPFVAEGKARGCDTLIMTFTDGRVSDLKIVNPRATAVIAASLQRQPAAVQIALN